MVPDYSHVPRKLYDTGLFNLRTEAGAGAYVDAVVAVLHGLDERWGHLKKKPGQTALHGHGEDAALYLADEPGHSQAVDFVGGAGGPNPQPAWQVDQPRYSESDWLNPTEHGLDAAPPPAMWIPSYSELGDDAFFRAFVGVPLQADMLMSGQPLNEGSAVWFSRAVYRLITAAIRTATTGAHFDPAGEVRIVRNEWRAILGQPPV